MNLELEEDFNSQRWRVLALIDGRKSLTDGSDAAIKTDFEIRVTRVLLRSCETLKGSWSEKAPSPTVHPVDYLEATRELDHGDAIRTSSRLGLRSNCNIALKNPD
jgi:hypothetical protein